jgi:NADPH2:quinone reductase
MRAAVVHEPGPPEALRYEELPDPECHPRGVVIEVEAASIEGGDLRARALGPLPRTPHVVGYQCAGVIREVGADVTDREVGQRVVAVSAAGSHAELRSVPSRATWVLPDGLGAEEATCIPVPFATAHDCLFEFGRVAEGETVLIQGAAGGLGVAAIQLAKGAGATVIGTSSSDEKLARLTELGLDHGVNSASSDPVAAVQELTEERGVDLIIDPVGGATLQRSLAMLAYRGRAITVGNASRGDAVIDISPLMNGNRSLTGVYLAAEQGRNFARVQALIAELLGRVASGELRVLIDRRFPLAEAGAAHAYAESRQALGRVLLIP